MRFVGTRRSVSSVARKALVILLAALLTAVPCAAGSLDYSIVWNRSPVSGKFQFPQALIRSSDGSYALAGYGLVELVPGSVGALIGFWTERLDRDGKPMWQRGFAAEPPKRREEAHTLIETRDGGFLVVGATESDSLAGRPVGQTNDPRSSPQSSAGFAIKY